METDIVKFLKNIKWDIYKILLGILGVSLISFWIFTIYQTNILKSDTEGLSLLEYVNSGVQRISKLELEHSSDELLIIDMDNVTNQLLLSDEYFTTDREMQLLIEEFVADWGIFKRAITDFQMTDDRDLLFIASESNYTDTFMIIASVQTYIKDFEARVQQLEFYSILHVVAMGLLLIKILFSTVLELKANKELSATMFIDTSTGLYNRSKCQEILKNENSPEKNKERAVVIFDLNDLKKTNDGLGHRAGDDLIASFAQVLKSATEVFSYDTFVGRYGGDEFMVYFASTEEKDVELYIKEVDYLMDNFNQEGSKPFKLSCAAGYCITNADTKSLTMRELFDSADESMYKNKLAMKEKKRQELQEKGIIEPTVIDERLL